MYLYNVYVLIVKTEIKTLKIYEYISSSRTNIYIYISDINYTSILVLIIILK